MGLFFICAPNLKGLAVAIERFCSVDSLRRGAIPLHFIGQKLYGGPTILKLGHMTLERPIRGRFMVHTQKRSVLDVCTKFDVDYVNSFKSYKGSPKIWKLGNVTPATPTYGSL